MKRAAVSARLASVRNRRLDWSREMFDESSRMAVNRASRRSEGRSAGFSMFPHAGNIKKPGLHRGPKSVVVQTGWKRMNVEDVVSEEDTKGPFFPLSPFS